MAAATVSGSPFIVGIILYFVSNCIPSLCVTLLRRMYRTECKISIRTIVNTYASVADDNYYTYYTIIEVHTNRSDVDNKLILLLFATLVSTQCPSDGSRQSAPITIKFQIIPPRLLLYHFYTNKGDLTVQNGFTTFIESVQCVN